MISFQILMTNTKSVNLFKKKVFFPIYCSWKEKETMSNENTYFENNIEIIWTWFNSNRMHNWIGIVKSFTLFNFKLYFSFGFNSKFFFLKKHREKHVKSNLIRTVDSKILGIDVKVCSNEMFFIFFDFQFNKTLNKTWNQSQYGNKLQQYFINITLFGILNWPLCIFKFKIESKIK